MQHAVVLYTQQGHKVPLDLEVAQPPVICVAPNGRYFAVAIAPGSVETHDGRVIYMEVTLVTAKLDEAVLPL